MSTISSILESTNKRADGNSTRIINNAIELLFQGYCVKVEDHFENGTSLKANRVIFVKLLDRLFYEHNLLRMIENKKIRIDHSKLEIELIK